MGVDDGRHDPKQGEMSVQPHVTQQSIDRQRLIVGHPALTNVLDGERGCTVWAGAASGSASDRLWEFLEGRKA